MRTLIVILFALAGLSGCTRDEQTLTAAERVLSNHFDCIRAGDTNALLTRYAPEFFREPNHGREQVVASMTRLRAEGAPEFTIFRRDVRRVSTGVFVSLGCQSRYGTRSFQEDFEFYQADGMTNFVITRHDFD
jgi:hypothetical protein